jgi:hypothetical protein
MGGVQVSQSLTVTFICDNLNKHHQLFIAGYFLDWISEVPGVIMQRWFWE